jgi:hypothetical protein
VEPEYADFLKGKRIAIIGDADDPGRRHAQRVARSLFGRRVPEATGTSRERPFRMG